MDIPKFAEEVFAKDQRVRYVGVIDNEYHVLISKMREGISSVTTDEQERNFVQIIPPIIVDAVEKMQPMLGKLDNVTLRYEKVLIVFFHLHGLVVILTFNADVTSPFISSLSDTITKLGSKYLKP